MIRVTPKDKLTSWRASVAEQRQLFSHSLTTPASGPITRAIRFSLPCPEVQSKVKNTVQKQSEVGVCHHHMLGSKKEVTSFLYKKERKKEMSILSNLTRSI